MRMLSASWTCTTGSTWLLNAASFELVSCSLFPSAAHAALAPSSSYSRYTAIYITGKLKNYGAMLDDAL